MFLTIQTIKTLFLFDIIVRNFSIEKINDAKIVGTFYLFLCLISMILRPKQIDMCFPLHLKNANVKCGNIFLSFISWSKKG